MRVECVLPQVVARGAPPHEQFPVGALFGMTDGLGAMAAARLLHLLVGLRDGQEVIRAALSGQPYAFGLVGWTAGQRPSRRLRLKLDGIGLSAGST